MLVNKFGALALMKSEIDPDHPQNLGYLYAGFKKRRGEYIKVTHSDDMGYFIEDKDGTYWNADTLGQAFMKELLDVRISRP